MMVGPELPARDGGTATAGDRPPVGAKIQDPPGPGPRAPESQGPLDRPEIQNPIRNPSRRLSLPDRFHRRANRVVLSSLIALERRLRGGPMIVGVTGSYGKTITARWAAALLERHEAAVLDPRERTTGIGTLQAALRLPPITRPDLVYRRLVPIAARVLLRTLLFRRIPAVVVLELRSQMGRGRVMRSVIEILRPRVGILTAIAPVHLEGFGAMGNIVAAKRSLVELLPQDGLAILNGDDERVRRSADIARAKVLFYGLRPDADVRAEGLAAGPCGIRFDLVAPQGRTPVEIPGTLNRHHASAALAAAALALHRGMALPAVARGLKGMSPPPGRGRLLPGLKGALLIDDSYNANPRSMEAGLFSLHDGAGGRRRIAVLGEMKELGPFTEEAHREAGRAAAKACDLLLAVGGNARIIAEEAARHGLPEGAVRRFDEARSAAQWLRGEISGGDLVLFKGSHGVGLRMAVEALSERPAPPPTHPGSYCTIAGSVIRWVHENAHRATARVSSCRDPGRIRSPQGVEVRRHSRAAGPRVGPGTPERFRLDRRPRRRRRGAPSGFELS